MSWTNPTLRATGDLITASIWNGDVVNNLLASNSVGSLRFVIVESAGNAVESVYQGGWLEWNAAVVSRTTYASLHSYMAARTPAYAPGNSGDGSTTFGLGSLRGRVPIHMGAGSTINQLGKNDGVTDGNRQGQRHRHTAHNHGGSTGNDSPDHTHAQQTSNGAGGTFTTSTNSTGAVGQQPVGSTGGASARHTHSISSVDGGSGTATDPLDGGAFEVSGIWVVKF